MRAEVLPNPPAQTAASACRAARVAVRQALALFLQREQPGRVLAQCRPAVSLESYPNFGGVAESVPLVPPKSMPRLVSTRTSPAIGSPVGNTPLDL